ncbi:MAG: FeoB-associated Cys-rich membrane protein [Lachnospiraceae bacterium]|nr:FeoB-associated Cys-rich membrane protein [Mediterraneibacter agrestimuris]MDE6956586.1 FeoB-associated Cys-rich membrane protein [Lachnospiraceae bacterium]
MGTIIVLLILAGAVGLVLRKMIKDKKAGKSIHCGGDCGHCKNPCR